MSSNYTEPTEAINAFRDSYVELQTAVIESRAAFDTALQCGDAAAANLAHEQLSESLSAFRQIAEQSMHTLDDGREILLTDYLGLKKLAEDNGIDLDSVLSHINKVRDGRVTDLRIPSRNLSNIDGLSTLTGLTVLVLNNNYEISDLSPLQDLTGLIVLDLCHNQARDLSPLKKLVRLERLNLICNQISDLSPLGNLISLTWLNLHGNAISDLTELGKLTLLEGLVLGKNKINNLSPLAHLPNLLELRIAGNPIEDDSVLNDLKLRGCDIKR